MKTRAVVKINRVFSTRLYNGDSNYPGIEMLLDLKAVNAVYPAVGTGGQHTMCVIQGKATEIHERYDDFSVVWKRFKEQQS